MNSRQKVFRFWAEAPFSPVDPTPELAIEKKADKEIYSVGDTGHYTVKVTQTADDATARNVVIEDQLQVSGAKVVKDSVKISDKDGKDFF